MLSLALPFIGVLIGAVLGLTGAGGSILAVPLLILLLAVEPTTATGLALGVVAISSAYGALRRIRYGEVLWLPVLVFGLSGALLAPIGRLLASALPSAVLLSGFFLLSCTIAVRMLRQSYQHPERARVVRASHAVETSPEPLRCRLSSSGHLEFKLPCVAGLSIGGAITGLLSGLFGVGGGFLIVPFLNQVNGVAMSRAVATSLVVIALVAGSGFATYLATHAVDWPPLALLAAGGIAGMALGSALARKIAGPLLQRIFAVAIVAMAALVLLR